MVWPDIVVTMSPGRCALPSGMFSTSPMTPTALTLRLARGERVHQPDDAGGAAHVALHVLHAGGRLDRDAAGVEADALADEGDRLGASLAAVPAHDHERLFMRASPGRRRAARPCRASSSPATSSTSTSTPSFFSSRARRANSTGYSTLAGSLTRSRAMTTPSAIAWCGPGLLGGRRVGAGEIDFDLVGALFVLLSLGLVAVERIGAQLQAEREIRRPARP